MKIMMIDCSPKVSESNSSYFLDALSKFINEKDIIKYKLVKNQGYENIINNILNIDKLIIALPLYVDSIPSHLLRLLTFIEDEFKGILKNIKVYVMINCGFYEGIQNRTSLICAKTHQFSSEKLLEDELTSRIESGTEVFGMNLKMYKRKGAYGRQFIIPVGRLDLLCEDDKGNLYVIELKKDSGYSDAYEQTAMYLDWFEKNKFAEGKKIYGIICLNSPTEDLLEKVHKDKRIEVIFGGGVSFLI